MVCLFTSFSLSDTDCGYIMTIKAGRIQSSDSVVHHESNIVCLWMIEKEHTAAHLQVLIVHMHIPSTSNCSESYLMVIYFIFCFCHDSDYYYYAIRLIVILQSFKYFVYHK